MFVHAYQSYLFNEAVSNRVAMGIDTYIEGDIMIDPEEHIVYDKTERRRIETLPAVCLNGKYIVLAETLIASLGNTSDSCVESGAVAAACKDTDSSFHDLDPPIVMI